MKKYKKTKQTSDPVRKITKVGKYSYSVTIPKDMIKKLGWKERQKVVVKQKGKSITVKDWN